MEKILDERSTVDDAAPTALGLSWSESAFRDSELQTEAGLGMQYICNSLALFH